MGPRWETCRPSKCAEVGRERASTVLPISARGAFIFGSASVMLISWLSKATISAGVIQWLSGRRAACGSPNGRLNDLQDLDDGRTRQALQAFRPRRVEIINDLMPGRGAIIRVGLRKIAAFRDDDGGIHRVS